MVQGDVVVHVQVAVMVQVRVGVIEQVQVGVVVQGHMVVQPHAIPCNPMQTHET